MPNFPLGFMVVPLCVIAVCAGCGTDGPELGTVSGTVTLDGAPLPNVLVVFNPGNARPSEGRTDATGHYEMQYTREQPGAILGQHKVIITSKVGVAEEGEEIVDEPETIPEKYNTETTLSLEVKSGNNTCDFDLQS